MLKYLPKTARITTFTGAQSAWRDGYRLAILNAALFLVLSTSALMVGANAVPVQTGIALLFFAGSILAGVNLLRKGGELAAVSYFVLGTGLYYGFGTAFSTMSDSIILNLAFPRTDQVAFLPRINLLNSVSTLVALVVAWPLSHMPPSSQVGRKSLRIALDSLNSLQLPLLLFTMPIVLLKIATFPNPQNLLLRSVVTNAYNIPYIAFLLSGIFWSRLAIMQKTLAGALITGLSLLGILSLSKTDMLLPFMAFGVGLLFDPRSRKTFIWLSIAVVAGYFLVFGSLCNQGRNHQLYQPDDNTIGERATIIADTLPTVFSIDQPLGQLNILLLRFTAAPVQAFLMNRYDGGAPGASLDEGWQALVPRILWPNKPIITRFGEELDGLFFSRVQFGSALAPTYTAEAYWNGGWWGVIIVSIIIGLEIGWFTQRWNAFIHKGIRYVGILVFAAPVAKLALSGGWIVSTYIGGFATLVILIRAADIIIPMLLRPLLVRKNHRQASFAFRPALQTRKRAS